jgi:hypothetical protein
MGIEQVFNGVIDLPKSKYFFTLRVTFWQAFFTLRVTFWQALFAFLHIFFVAIDTAINDIIDRAIATVKRKTEKLVMGIGELFCPRVAYA